MGECGTTGHDDVFLSPKTLYVINNDFTIQNKWKTEPSKYCVMIQ